MRLIHVASVLFSSSGGASANLGGSHENKNSCPLSVDEVRAMQRLSQGGRSEKHRDLFIGGVSPMFGLGGSTKCGKTCEDPNHCYSSMATVNRKESCDAGCVPEFVVSTCGQFCGRASDSDADTDSDADSVAKVTAEQRLGSFGFAADRYDFVCANCEFYKCCISDEVTENKYETCKDFLMPDKESFFSRTFEGWNVSRENFGSFLNSLFPCARESRSTSNALFLHAKGFEDMCATECNGAKDFLSTTVCSLCDIAQCCKTEGDGASFVESAHEVISDMVENTALMIILGFAVATAASLSVVLLYHEYHNKEHLG